MATPFPFTTGQVLTAAQMNSIGEAAVTFTPTFTGYTRGNGTSVAYYTRINKLTYVYVEETLGSTSAMGTSPTFVLPFAATRIESVPITRCRIDDAGANVFWATIAPVSTTAMTIYADRADLAYVAFASVTAIVPMTWTTGDIFAFAFIYETV